jgi:hypothetical protein
MAEKEQAAQQQNDVSQNMVGLAPNSTAPLFQVNHVTTAVVRLISSPLPFDGGQISCNMSDDSKALIITGASLKPIAGQTVIPATFTIAGLQPSTALNGDSVTFTAKGKTIGALPVTIFAVKLLDKGSGQVIPYGGDAFIDANAGMPALQAQIIPDLKTAIGWELRLNYAGYSVLGFPTEDVYPSSGVPAQVASRLSWNIAGEWPNTVPDPTGSTGATRGGSATLTFHIGSLIAGEYSFAVKGTNPAPADAEAAIGSSPWYAAAIAREENGSQNGRCYLQFNEVNSGGSGLKGQPTFGSPRGFGMFQLDNSPTPSKEAIWNWRKNVQAGLQKIKDISKEAPLYFSAIKRTYPDQWESPPATVTIEGTAISYLDASAIEMYNGATQTVLLKNPYGGWSPYRSAWAFDKDAPSGKRWSFVDNANRYVAKVVCYYSKGCNGGCQ